MPGLKWQHSCGGQLDSHWYESKNTAGTTGIYPLLLLHSFPHTVIKGSLDNSTDWGPHLMRHENILIATRGYDMVCVLKIHMHPISPNWDLRILTLSGIDRLTFWYCFFFGSASMVIWHSSNVADYNCLVLKIFLFLIIQISFNSRHWSQRDAKRCVPGTPSPNWLPYTSSCACWEKGANPPPHVPFGPRSEEVESVFNWLSLELFPGSHSGKETLC